MITSKERSKLNSLANSINTLVYMGKNGVTEAFLAQVDEMLNDHELLKIGVQKNCEYTAKEVINALCDALDAEPVHAIGNKIIIYRLSNKEGVKHVL